MASGFIEIINKIIKFFKNVQKKFNDFTKGTTSFGGALLSGLIAVFESFKIGGRSLIFNTGTMMEVVWQYIECFGEFIFKLPQCFVIHILNLAIMLAYYLFFRLPVMLLELILGINLQPELDVLASIIREGDEIVHDLTGIYLTRLPPPLEKRCYSCRGRRMTLKELDKGREKLEKAGDKINRDFNVKIPKVFRRPKSKMDGALKKLKRVFS